MIFAIYTDLCFAQPSACYSCLVFLHNRRDIFVLTAQILVNALTSLQHFSLIVFDECHHATKKHMYNEILSRYLDLKMVDPTDDSQLPQVVQKRLIKLTVMGCLA